MYIDENGLFQWKYKNNNTSTGYEDVIDDIKKYSGVEYRKLSEEEQNVWVNEIFNIYRSKNIFPIIYYDEYGMIKEINKCIDRSVSITDNVISSNFTHGQSICRFLFPNIVHCRRNGEKSAFEKFNDDIILKRCISFTLKHCNYATPNAIRTVLNITSGNVPTGFKAMTAKAIYEKYTPENGVIYDFSGGFGGRMIGALTSKNNYKYICVEPEINNFNGLNNLGHLIEKATNTNDRFEVHKCGSEFFRGGEKSVDFAFSSPPYFNLEIYSNDKSQCYNAHDNIEAWFLNYVIPTIENINYMLKDDGFYAVNINDFKVNNKTINFVDEWIKISQMLGFKHVDTLIMNLNKRSGTGHDKKNGNTRSEKVFVFKKVN